MIIVHTILFLAPITTKITDIKSTCPTYKPNCGFSNYVLIILLGI